MSLSIVRNVVNLGRPLQRAVLRPVGCRGFAAGDKLESDTRTTKPQQRASDTDEATKESVSHPVGPWWWQPIPQPLAYWWCGIQWGCW